MTASRARARPPPRLKCRAGLFGVMLPRSSGGGKRQTQVIVTGFRAVFDAARKLPHQADAEPAGGRLLERLRARGSCEGGRIKRAAVILDGQDNVNSLTCDAHDDLAC